MLDPNIDTIRLFIHVLSASVWVGGQIVLAGVVPRLRQVGPDATRAVANGFARVAWPAFAIAFFSGIWNVLAIEDSSSLSYNVTLGIKLILVMVAGASAFQHSRTSSKPVLAMTGAIGAVTSVVVLFLGVLLSNPS